MARRWVLNSIDKEYRHPFSILCRQQNKWQRRRKLIINILAHKYVSLYISNPICFYIHTFCCVKFHWFSFSRSSYVICISPSAYKQDTQCHDSIDWPFFNFLHWMLWELRFDFSTSVIFLWQLGDFFFKRTRLDDFRQHFVLFFVQANTLLSRQHDAIFLVELQPIIDKMVCQRRIRVTFQLMVVVVVVVRCVCVCVCVCVSVCVCVCVRERES